MKVAWKVYFKRVNLAKTFARQLSGHWLHDMAIVELNPWDRFLLTFKFFYVMRLTTVRHLCVQFLLYAKVSRFSLLSSIHRGVQEHLEQLKLSSRLGPLVLLGSVSYRCACKYPFLQKASIVLSSGSFTTWASILFQMETFCYRSI